MAQLIADEQYERKFGRVSETVATLNAIFESGTNLIELIMRLSPVGTAAMFEAGLQRDVKTGTHELQALSIALGAPRPECGCWRRSAYLDALTISRNRTGCRLVARPGA